MINRGSVSISVGSVYGSGRIIRDLLILSFHQSFSLSYKDAYVKKKKENCYWKENSDRKRESCQVEFVTRVMPCVKLCWVSLVNNYYTFSDSFN